MTRYIVYGAGGVGALIGGRLALSGHEVTLVARGAHGAALAERGLDLRTPQSRDLIRIPVKDSVEGLSIGPEEVVVLAMKTQDVGPALQQLTAVAARETAIVCGQNGLEAERLALRLFPNVYGLFVHVLAALGEPGVVGGYTAPCFGILDLGRFPGGDDERASAIAADLRGAGFESVARPDIMSWKRGKLMINAVSNAPRALCPPRENVDEVVRAVRTEIEQCYVAAGWDHVTPEEILARGEQHLTYGRIDGRGFPGSSTSQDFARGASGTEIDYINGEIVLLGRLYGVKTPVNAALQDMVRLAIRSRAGAGAFSVAEILDRASKAEPTSLPVR
jgi:2-dehydropantoate 2-reductase